MAVISVRVRTVFTLWVAKEDLCWLSCTLDCLSSMWVPGRYTLSDSTPNKNSSKNCWTGGAGKTTDPEDADPIGAYQKKGKAMDTMTDHHRERRRRGCK
ncbi:hypothetical protein NC653_029610 [Populus alba x Populus x berolinensis]|uniref:Uncharacterized protein n=1 Tax=Populus alba x Populus x berolinensis TaxID=444605 RepID=A0AAD6Q5F4_9ROSI|nr:hypothetical protein NC653_029610 [Populus alba x Populus x berolinensis]